MSILGKGRSIWVFAVLYFACYLPYTSLTKSLGNGLLPGQSGGLPGAALLPMSTLAGLVVMLLVTGITGWWKELDRGPGGVPVPRLRAALSGLCTATILSTTTIAWALEGVPIVRVLLVMRAGVLLLAPAVDLVQGRRPRPAAWVALALALGALLVGGSGEGGFTTAAWIDLGLYIAAYFLRFQIMGTMAKTQDPAATRRFFTEEQLVAAPAAFLAMIPLALWGPHPLDAQVISGFELDPALLLPVLMLGAGSQLVGIFGTLILLDPREHTFAVLVNRCASVLAVVSAAFALHYILGAALPSAAELGGAAMVLAAVVLLALSG